MMAKKRVSTNMSECRFSYKLCDYLRRLLWLCQRYPAFTSSFIEKHIDKPDTERHELLAYQQNCTSASKRNAIALILLYIAFGSKSLWVAYESLQLYNYELFESNIKHVDELAWLNHTLPLNTLKSISACLLTNCTRLAPPRLSTSSSSSASLRISATFDQQFIHQVKFGPLEKLGEDASHLPIFSLCHPRADYFFTPITKLDSSGILFYALSIYTVVLFGVWTTIKQLIAPASSDLLMFIAVPKVTLEMARKRAHEFHSHLLISYRNFRSCSIWSYQLSSELLSIFNTKQQRIENDDDDEDDDDDLEQEPETNTIDNCLPITRSEWWRKRLATIYICTSLYASLFIIAVGCFLMHEVNFRSREKHRLLVEYAHEMERQNCYIWSTGGEEPIDLSSLQVEWTWYSYLEITSLNYGPGLAIAMLFTYYWALMCEASIRLAELRMFLVSSLFATRIQNIYSRHRMIANDDDIEQNNYNYQHVHPSVERRLLANTRALYTVANLRRRFRNSLITFKIVAYFCSRHRRIDIQTSGQSVKQVSKFNYLLVNSTSNDHYQVMEFLNEILQHDKQARKQLIIIGFNIETLEQIYVNFRLFVDHIHSLKPSVAIALSIINFLNYGYVLIAVISRRKMATIKTEEVMIIITFAWLIANYLIVMSANVHANAKKLHPLIWSIIAQLTDWQCLRAKHLRLLWLKQVTMLDNEGGLALTAFGLRVTYVYILQLMIWTATIFVIALKQN